MHGGASAHGVAHSTRPVQHRNRNRNRMASDDFLQLHRCAASGDAVVGTAGVLRRIGHAPDEITSIVAALTTAAAASSAGHTEVCRVLIEDGRADPALVGSSLLLTAVFAGDKARLRLLLADGRADPTTYDSYVLRVAAESSNHAVLQLLLEDGRADPVEALKQLLMLQGHPGLRQVAWFIERNLQAIRAALCWRWRRPWLRASAVEMQRGV
jgi:hypothetical protein